MHVCALSLSLSLTLGSALGPAISAIHAAMRRIKILSEKLARRARPGALAETLMRRSSRAEDGITL